MNNEKNLVGKNLARKKLWIKEETRHHKNLYFVIFPSGRASSNAW